MYIESNWFEKSKYDKSVAFTVQVCCDIIYDIELMFTKLGGRYDNGKKECLGDL